MRFSDHSLSERPEIELFDEETKYVIATFLGTWTAYGNSINKAYRRSQQLPEDSQRNTDAIAQLRAIGFDV